MRTNYVLVDYENVRPESFELLTPDCFRLFVFVGANQNKLLYDVVASIQPFGERAKYVKICGNGPNALDLHIAYYIGKLAAAEPSAYFHIVSKDTGFDPLIQHLRSYKLSVDRVESIADIPLVKTSDAKSPEERMEIVLTNFRQRGTSKPGTVKTLSSTVAALFQKKLSEPEVSSVVKALADHGHLSISGNRITYPSSEPAQSHR